MSTATSSTPESTRNRIVNRLLRLSLEKLAADFERFAFPWHGDNIMLLNQDSFAQGAIITIKNEIGNGRVRRMVYAYRVRRPFSSQPDQDFEFAIECINVTYSDITDLLSEVMAESYARDEYAPGTASAQPRPVDAPPAANESPAPPVADVVAAAPAPDPDDEYSHEWRMWAAPGVLSAVYARTFDEVAA